MELNEVIQKFENGESVKTVEMGGLGLSYETALQTLAFHLMKRGKIVKSISEFEIPEELKDYGFSGAQVGAAANLSNLFLKQGYEKALEMAIEHSGADRVIEIKKVTTEELKKMFEIEDINEVLGGSNENK